MKRTVSIILIMVSVLLCFTACGNKIEKADKYIKQCNKDLLENCAYKSEYIEGEMSFYRNAYQVSVKLPFDSDQQGMATLVASRVARTIYPELESILKNDESVEHISIFFYYLDGYMYHDTYFDGKWVSLD